MHFYYVTLYLRVPQVPEQQQDQRVGARSPGPPGLNTPDPETEPKPHQPDPRQSLSAPEAHPAVSTAGFLRLGDALRVQPRSRRSSVKITIVYV